MLVNAGVRHSSLRQQFPARCAITMIDFIAVNLLAYVQILNSVVQNSYNHNVVSIQNRTANKANVMRKTDIFLKRMRQKTTLWYNLSQICPGMIMPWLCGLTEIGHNFYERPISRFHLCRHFRPFRELLAH